MSPDVEQKFLNRQNLLVSGALLLSVSPFLSCFCFSCAALVLLPEVERFGFDRGRKTVGGLIIVVSAWMVFRKIGPENLLPGTVTFSDYAPFFVFFFLLSLKPFLESEIKSFFAALLLTVPQQFYLAYGERYLNWHGSHVVSWNGVALWDVFIGPYEVGANTSAGWYNPNILAFYCLMCISVALVLLLREADEILVSRRVSPGSGARAVLAGICLALGAVLLMWTHSRNGWLSFVCAVAMCLWLSRGKWFLKIAGAVLPLLTILASVNLGRISEAVRPLFPPGVASRLASIYEVFSPGDRGAIFQCALGLIKEKPLKGWGFGSLATECTRRTGIGTDHAHNIILQLGAETGIPCTVLVVCLVGLIYYYIIRHLIKEKAEGAKIYSLDAGILAVVSAALLMQFADLALLMTYRLNFIFWILLAIPYSRALRPCDSEPKI